MHRGKNPAILVAKLVGWRLSEAQSYIETQGSNPDDFAKAVSSLQEKAVVEEKLDGKNLYMPQQFRKFDGRFPRSEQRFKDYLRGRGFKSGLELMSHFYDLHYCVSGEYAERLIIPVCQGGVLITWTARAIKTTNIRYKSLEDDYSIINIKNCLMVRRRLRFANQPSILVLVEGPIDYMKVDFYGRHKGVEAGCLFGKTLSDEQRISLLKMHRYFKRIYVLLDEDARLDCGIMVSELKEIIGDKIKPLTMPKGSAEDPGDLTIEQIERLSKRLSEDSK